MFFFDTLKKSEILSLKKLVIKSVFRCTQKKLTVLLKIVFFKKGNIILHMGIFLNILFTFSKYYMYFEKVNKIFIAINFNKHIFNLLIFKILIFIA